MGDYHGAFALGRRREHNSKEIPGPWAIIMVMSIKTKMGRNLRCISLHYNKEDTIENEKNLRRQF